MKDCLKPYWGRCLPFSFKKQHQRFTTHLKVLMFLFFLVLKKKELHAVESFISHHNHCSIEIFILKGSSFFAHVFSNFCSGKSQCQQFETWQVNHFKVHNSWRKGKSREFSGGCELAAYIYLNRSQFASQIN